MNNFHEELSFVMERQYNLYEPYQTLCEMEGISQQDIKSMIASGDLHLIPAIPAEWFKRNRGKGLFLKLSNLQESGQWLVSSSTSGDASYTWRTESDITSIEESFTSAFQKPPSCKALLFSPDTKFLNSVGERLAVDERGIKFYATVPLSMAEAVFLDAEYMAGLDREKTMEVGRPVLDLNIDLLIDTIQYAEKNNTPLMFAVSVLMLYPALEKLPMNYSLGDNAFFYTGAGGWDGKKGTTEGAPITKTHFVSDMCTKFEIPESSIETNFWDGYGTTENGKAQAGIFSKEYGDFVFNVENDVKLYVINPIDGRPSRVGEKGYPRFISPYGVDGFAGACVQQNDIVTVVSLNDDGSVKEFTQISRSSGDEGAGGVGCAYELVEGVDV